jgi:hypothetical protein
MCFEINRYANYVPIPKQTRCTPHQGLGEPKVSGSDWECDDDHVWNQQDEAIPADHLLAIFRRAWGLRAKPRCVLGSTRYENYGPVPKTGQMALVDCRGGPWKIGNRKSAIERPIRLASRGYFSWQAAAPLRGYTPARWAGPL